MRIDCNQIKSGTAIEVDKSDKRQRAGRQLELTSTLRFYSSTGQRTAADLSPLKSEERASLTGTRARYTNRFTRLDNHRGGQRRYGLETLGEKRRQQGGAKEKDRERKGTLKFYFVWPQYRKVRYFVTYTIILWKVSRDWRTTNAVSKIMPSLWLQLCYWIIRQMKVWPTFWERGQVKVTAYEYVALYISILITARVIKHNY